MKKILIAMLVTLLVLVGCSTTSVSHEVKLSEIIEKIENKDSFILYIGSSECAACQSFAPTYQEAAAEYPAEMYSIEILSAKADHNADLTKLMEDSLGEIEVTPTIFAIKDGVVVDKKTGVMKYSQLMSMMERHEIIK